MGLTKKKNKLHKLHLVKLPSKKKQLFVEKIESTFTKRPYKFNLYVCNLDIRI